MIPTINPWKGLLPYDDSKEDLELHPFCGRESVVRELFDLIDNNIITTLYGKSGIGKTSLLKAGLFPKLREEDYVPVYVRLSVNRQDSETYAECIIRILRDYTSALLEQEKELYSMPEDKESVDYLWAFFAKYSYYDENRVKFPVIILDQFEEVFNDDSDAVKLLLLQLHELTSDKLLPSGEKYLINFRIVLSIREDDLFLLEDAIDTFYTPLLKSNRYRLKPLGTKEAIRVIEVRQSNNTALCEDLFDLEQKDNIIKSIIQVATSSEKNNEINTQILSLTCKLLYDKWIKEEKRSCINYSVIQESDVIKEFYYNIISEIPSHFQMEFEENLVTESGRRKAWDLDRGYKSFYRRAFPASNVNDVDHFLEGENAILRNITTHGTKCVELVHDSLAKVAISHLSINKLNEKHNSERKKRENVLTIFGRELFSNQFVDFGPNDDENMKSSLVSDLIRSNFSPQNFISKLGVTSLSQIIEDSNNKDNSLCISFEDGTESMTKDGIYKLWVKFDEQHRISKILFYGQTIDEKNLIVTRNGFCGIELEYDQFGNEITRKYLGINGKPTINLYCYSIIKRTYDSFGRPILTLYYDVDGETPCRHYDGIYGFKSVYDDAGNETLRTFLDSNGEDLCQIRSGVYGQKAIYNDEDKIKYVINVDKQLNPCRNFWGVTAIHIEYDELQRIHKETFCDEEFKATDCRTGYSISIYDYDSNSRIASCSFYNSHLQEVLIRDGYHKFVINYDEKGFPSLVTFLGLNNEFTVDSNGSSSVRRVFNDIGQEIEYQYLGPDLCPMYNIAQFCYQKTSYKSALLSSVTLLNHKQQIVTTDDRYFRIEYEWDKYGYHIIEERYFDSVHKEPDKTIKQEWISDYEYVAKEYNCDNQFYARKIRIDPAGRMIYEERLDQDTGWHHKKMFYSDSSRVFYELYYNEDDSPYFNEIGDSGIEFIYNDLGAIIGHASIDAGGTRRINKCGYCVEMIERDKKSDSNISKYYDVDGITPVKRIDLGYHKNEGNRAFYDEFGNLCNNVFGYAEVRLEENSERFFDSSGNPVMAYGYHKKTTVKSKSVTSEYYFNILGDLVINDEGYAVKVLDEDPNFFSSASKSIKYFGTDGKGIDGPHPEGKENKGSIFFFHKKDKIESIMYALNANGELIEGSRKRDVLYKMKVILLMIPFMLYAFITLVFYTIKTLMWRALHKSEIKSKSTVIKVKGIIDATSNLYNYFDDTQVSSLSKIASIQPNDVILRFGDWDYLKFENQEDCVNAFESEFHSKFKQCKKITIARIKRDNKNNLISPEIESFWVPNVMLGLHICDGSFNGSEEELSMLLDSYKKQQANEAP